MSLALGPAGQTQAAFAASLPRRGAPPKLCTHWQAVRSTRLSPGCVISAEARGLRHRQTCPVSAFTALRGPSGCSQSAGPLFIQRDLGLGARGRCKHAMGRPADLRVRAAASSASSPTPSPPNHPPPSSPPQHPPPLATSASSAAGIPSAAGTATGPRSISAPRSPNFKDSIPGPVTFLPEDDSLAYDSLANDSSLDDRFGRATGLEPRQQLKATKAAPYSSKTPSSSSSSSSPLAAAAAASSPGTARTPPPEFTQAEPRSDGGKYQGTIPAAAAPVSSPAIAGRKQGGTFSVAARASGPSRNFSSDSDLNPKRALPLPMTALNARPLSAEEVQELVACDPEIKNCKEPVYQWTSKCTKCEGTGYFKMRKSLGKRRKGGWGSSWEPKCITCHGIGYVYRYTVRDNIPVMEDVDRPDLDGIF